METHEKLLVFGCRLDGYVLVQTGLVDPHSIIQDEEDGVSLGLPAAF